MILISIFLILLLLGAALWLWYLSQAQLTHFAVSITESNFTLSRPVSKLSFPPLEEALSLLWFRRVRRETGFYPPDFFHEEVEREAEHIVPRLLLPPFLNPFTARYSGMANLPRKVYEGDSRNITLILNREGFVQGLHPEVSHVQEITKNKQTEQQITFDIQEKNSSEQFLEVRLRAAAFPTKGDEKQRQSLTQERLEYRWNCYFQSAGHHDIFLELKVIYLSEERPLAVIGQRIRVVKLDHMTQSHVQVAALLIGIIGLVSTVVTIISNILKLRIP